MKVLQGLVFGGKLMQCLIYYVLDVLQLLQYGGMLGILKFNSSMVRERATKIC